MTTANKQIFTDNLRKAGVALINLSAEILATSMDNDTEAALCLYDSVHVDLADLNNIEFGKKVKLANASQVFRGIKQ